MHLQINFEGGRKKMIKPFTVYGNNIGNYDHTQQLAEINYNVCQGNLLLQDYRNYVAKRLDEATCKKKKSCLSRMISMTNAGEIMLTEYFDNNSIKSEPFILNIRGGWKIFRVKFEKTKQEKEYFEIFFEISQKRIFGKIAKNTAEGLYRYFICEGIIFNNKIAEGTIKKVLFQTFGPQIENCSIEHKIPELAGWNFGYFMHALNNPFTKGNDIPKLPVLQKEFVIVNDIKRIEKYLESLRGIRQWKNRVILLLIPFLGILSSIFNEVEIEKVCFNFVCLNVENSRFLTRLFQIFNRSTCELINLDRTDKEIRTKLLQSNDEVVMLDAISENGTAYQKKKVEGNIKRIVEKICFHGSSAFDMQREISAQLVIFNNSVLIHSKVFNLFVDDDFFCDRLDIEIALREKSLEAFFTGFIRFVEGNMDETRRKIRKLERLLPVDINEKSIVMAWEILRWFCIAEGIDLENMIQLPNKIDFTDFFAEEFEPDDLMESFVKIVRREIKHWKISMKTQKIDSNYVGNSCFYDLEYLYIPTKIFDRMLGSNGYLQQKPKILSELRNRKGLKTNVEGMSCRLQINQQRFEVYIFKIEIFNKPGFPDIISLGKEAE